ncbi:glucosaminidase domain-containing protein [Hyphomicrobium sp.]|uniref:glucosaminidase domain-containing protein n=1 Tax=Hyphomicrobium sp. TaxID=82 RepID=UPI002D7A1D14|nr:glucosaminidase domain-containing protein [Hyphomicrobium sp.]
MATKSLASRIFACTLATASFAFAIGAAHAAPPIRMSESNQVPACVTPERLMAFVAERNPNLDPRYSEIANLYKKYGEAWRVRWDYAFYQMVIETNYLKFRREGGKRGDVWENQNNFAGIGATGGGVRGEFFPDIATGVHAQIQHLVAYSGERLASPVAKRTRENQDDIASQSKRLGRPVTFGDLARRWAADRAYGRSIDIIAGLYQKRFCNPSQAADGAMTAPAMQKRSEGFAPFLPPSGLGGPKPDAASGAEKALRKTAPAGASAPASKGRTKMDAPKKAASKAHKKTAPEKAKSKPSVASKSSSEPVAAPVATNGPAPVAPKVINVAWGGTTVIERQPPAPAGEATMNTTAAAQPAAPEAGGSSGFFSMPWLPTFKIAPSQEQPSRLGGPLPAELGAAAKAAQTAPAAPSDRCKVLSASYGGTKTLLLRSRLRGETQYTALTIVDGFEKSMYDAYVRTEAAGAEIIGEYPTQEAALTDAKFNCPQQ